MLKIKVKRRSDQRATPQDARYVFGPASIRYRGAVRTRMPQVQLRFEGYLIRETAGTTLGTPPHF
jgi:hypothetical protein